MMIYFTEKDTSGEKIREFLKSSSDGQMFHKPPYNVIPGMFYLYLASQHVEEGIVGVNIKIEQMRKYPLQGRIDIEKSQNTATAVIHDDKGILSRIEFKTDDRPDLTEARLSKVYSLAGKLLDHERDKLNEDKCALYCGQSAHFNGYEFDPDSVVIPVLGIPYKERKSFLYPIMWVSNEGNSGKLVEVGLGITNIRFITTEALERIISSI